MDYTNFEQLPTKERFEKLIQVIDAPSKPFPKEDVPEGTKVFYNVELYYGDELVQLRDNLRDNDFVKSNPSIKPMMKILQKHLKGTDKGTELDPKVLESCISEFEKI